MVATLNARGKMGVVMPHGVLFRGASEGEIRRGLLQEDLIEVVVGLPTNLVYGTGIPAAILVLNCDKPKEQRPDHSGLLPVYAVAFLNSPAGKRQSDQAAVGNAQPTVTLKSLSRFLLPIPTLAEQRSIGSRLDGVAQRLCSEQAVYQKQCAVKAALMSVLLTGELRVTPDEDSAQCPPSSATGRTGSSSSRTRDSSPGYGLHSTLHTPELHELPLTRVHVEAGGSYAKLWLEPVTFADSRGFNAKEMNEIRRLVVAHQQKCVEARDEFFSRKA